MRKIVTNLVLETFMMAILNDDGKVTKSTLNYKVKQIFPRFLRRIENLLVNYSDTPVNLPMQFTIML